MLISLHKQATTTPRVWAEIQACTEPAWVLAERFGTTEHGTPMQEMKEWYSRKPELFKKQLYHLTGCDN